MFKHNVIELSIRKLGPANYNHSSAIFCDMSEHAPQFIVRQFMVGDNIIREVDNHSDPGASATAIELTGRLESNVAKSAFLHRNLVCLDVKSGAGEPLGISFYRSGTSSFDNNTLEGKLVVAVNERTGEAAPEVVKTIEQRADELLCSALLRISKC